MIGRKGERTCGSGVILIGDRRTVSGGIADQDLTAEVAAARQGDLGNAIRLVDGVGCVAQQHRCCRQGWVGVTAIHHCGDLACIDAGGDYLHQPRQVAPGAGFANQGIPGKLAATGFDRQFRKR